MIFPAPCNEPINATGLKPAPSISAAKPSEPVTGGRAPADKQAGRVGARD